MGSAAGSLGNRAEKRPAAWCNFHSLGKGDWSGFVPDHLDGLAAVYRDLVLAEPVGDEKYFFKDVAQAWEAYCLYVTRIHAADRHAVLNYQQFFADFAGVFDHMLEAVLALDLEYGLEDGLSLIHI